MSCTTTLASCSLKCCLLWMCAKTDPKQGEKKNILAQSTGKKKGMSTFSYTDNWLQPSNRVLNKQQEPKIYNSPTSSELFKHQVEFVFLLEELHQLQDVPAEKQGNKKHRESDVSISSSTCRLKDPCWFLPDGVWWLIRCSRNWVAPSAVLSLWIHQVALCWAGVTEGRSFTCDPGTGKASQPHGRHGCGCDLVFSRWSATEQRKEGWATSSKNRPQNKRVPTVIFSTAAGMEGQSVRFHLMT